MADYQKLKYVKTHEWVELFQDKARIGITDHAQSSLGDIVYVNLPDVGTKIHVGERFMDIESVKAVSDIYAPLDGVVTAINEQLLDEPERINSEPYESWLIELAIDKTPEDLLDYDAYIRVVEEEAD